MPLNVKRFCTSVLLVLSFSILIFAQTTADVMRERVSKAKALIAVRNYGAAIYELENIRRETSDPTVNSVINVLLMSSFLEQGDYKRAQDFLSELSKSNKPNAAANYFAAASQVVKCARNQNDRFRSLGLSVSDPKLPKDALTDVDKMRETLEKVVEQTKVLSKDKEQTSSAMALMEEATVARGGLARDDYDATRWKNEAADAREDLASSRSVIINAVNETPAQTAPTQTETVASNQSSQSSNDPIKPIENAPLIKPVPTPAEKPIVAQNQPKENQPIIETPKPEIRKTDETSTNKENPSTDSTRTRRVENTNKETVAQKEPQTKETIVPKETKVENQPTNAPVELPKTSSPLEVGSLIAFATEKSNPVYPPMARNMRMSGVVKVELMVDENGKVAEVQNTSGPPMLQRAAMDAIKKWKFKPFTRDGQATKAIGFINFNFSL